MVIVMVHFEDSEDKLSRRLLVLCLTMLLVSLLDLSSSFQSMFPYLLLLACGSVLVLHHFYMQPFKCSFYAWSIGKQNVVEPKDNSWRTTRISPTIYPFYIHPNSISFALNHIIQIADEILRAIVRYYDVLIEKVLYVFKNL